MAEVLVADRGSRGARPGGGGAGVGPAVPRVPFAVLALGLAIVGVADAVLIWHPLEPGNAEWEFAAITRTFNGLALATIGIGGLAALAVGSGRRARIGLMSAVCALATLAIAATGVLYLLVIPVALGAAPAPLVDSLTLAIGKTLLYIVVYLGIYGFLTVYGWRRFNSLAGRS
jgi:hypothetical protein